jgi:hypothetical protein
LPEGFFSNQKSQFGKILEGLRWENVDIFCGLLEYFMYIWDILLPFRTFCVRLVLFVFIWYIFSGFGIMYHEKSGNPDREQQQRRFYGRRSNSEKKLLTKKWKKFIFLLPSRSRARHEFIFCFRTKFKKTTKKLFIFIKTSSKIMVKIKKNQLQAPGNDGVLF